MALTLHYHPLSSFCHKVLIALYENATPFTGRIVDLGDPADRAAFAALWPLGKFPVLRDDSRGLTVPESTTIIEYLDRHYPGARPLLPAAEDAQREARLWDRLFDLYVHLQMQKIVNDRLRPEAERDPRGVADARATLRTAYDLVDKHMADHTWAAGQDFTLADCAATPALFYAGIAMPFTDTHPHLAAYFERLLSRPSVQRVLAEARPYFHLFPLADKMPARFTSNTPPPA
ncbi:glutathione S-transferase family protein [Cupriavidus sp. 2TAF22]|uniref:glutathione S-transferase family protein n=1 Tax=unclassified Cupriavidus TaxID=2640874 RepID=UPI003F932F74